MRKNDNKKQNIRKYVSAILIVFAFAICCCVLISIFHLNLIKVTLPEYVQPSLKEDGSFAFNIDKDRLKYDYCFSDDTSLPENIALDSLSLIVTSNNGSYTFEVGSTLENAASLLNKGGYALFKTVWTCGQKEMSELYADSLTVRKHISLKPYVHFRSDGNFNWNPYIDYESLFASVGDRSQYNPDLRAALQSLSVTAQRYGEDLMKIETWSSFTSPTGLSIESVLQSYGVTIMDTVFIITDNDLISDNIRRLSLKNFCVLQYIDHGLDVSVDREAILSFFSIQKDSIAGKAIDAISLTAERQGDKYCISTFCTISDLDVPAVLYENGISLEDTCFFIPI